MAQLRTCSSAPSLCLELYVLKLTQCFIIIVYRPIFPGKMCASGGKNSVIQAHSPSSPLKQLLTHLEQTAIC